MNTFYLLLGIGLLAILLIIFRKRIIKISFNILNIIKAKIWMNGNNETTGGHGGDAKVSGNNSTAIGGKGGGGGPGGKGGDGGSAEGDGDNVFVMGGEGGEAGQINRGGKGGHGPLQVIREDYPEEGKEILKLLDMVGIDEEEAKKYGKGGDGVSSVQQIQKQKFEENKKNYLDSRNSSK